MWNQWFLIWIHSKSNVFASDDKPAKHWTLEHVETIQTIHTFYCNIHSTRTSLLLLVFNQWQFYLISFSIILFLHTVCDLWSSLCIEKIIIHFYSLNFCFHTIYLLFGSVVSFRTIIQIYYYTFISVWLHQFAEDSLFLFFWCTLTFSTSIQHTVYIGLNGIVHLICSN